MHSATLSTRNAVWHLTMTPAQSRACVVESDVCQVTPCCQPDWCKIKLHAGVGKMPGRVVEIKKKRNRWTGQWQPNGKMGKVIWSPRNFKRQTKNWVVGYVQIIVEIHMNYWLKFPGKKEIARRSIGSSSFARRINLWYSFLGGGDLSRVHRESVTSNAPHHRTSADRTSRDVIFCPCLFCLLSTRFIPMWICMSFSPEYIRFVSYFANTLLIPNHYKNLSYGLSSVPEPKSIYTARWLTLTGQQEDHPTWW